MGTERPGEEADGWRRSARSQPVRRPSQLRTITFQPRQRSSSAWSKTAWNNDTVSSTATPAGDENTRRR